MPEAITGLIGVVIGALLAPFFDWCKEKRSSKQKARFLAVSVICILDDFIDKCVDVACDDGEVGPDGIVLYSTPTPTIKGLSEISDWKTIDHKLMYEILSLPNKIKSTENYISFACDTWIGPPYDELGPELQYEYSKLGILANELATKLRTAYDIPERGGSERNPDWDSISFLEDKKKEIEIAKREYEKRQAELIEKISK